MTFKIKQLDSQIDNSASLLPRHPCSLTAVSPRGSGKSTVLINLITNKEAWKGFFDRICIWSPTVTLDAKWKTLLNQKGILRKPSPPQDEPGEICLFCDPCKRQKWTGKIPSSDVHSTYEQADLEEVMESQVSAIEDGEDKRVLVIFDDIVGLDVLNGKRAKKFTELHTTLRHYKCSCVIALQSYKLLNRTIRVNSSGLLIWGIKNKQELQKIEEEFPLTRNFKEFYELHHELTKHPFSFMYINLQNPVSHQVIANFDRYVQMDVDLVMGNEGEPSKGVFT